MLARMMEGLQLCLAPRGHLEPEHPDSKGAEMLNEVLAFVAH